jgi:2-dehydro-3-deoxy-D-gluconate 5-dehydrogenase
MSAAAPSFSLAGRVALVTGGNTGLGSGMAVGLASAGADIVSIGPGDPSETAAAVAAHGRRLHWIGATLGRGADYTAIVAESVATLGRADILVNNAGIIRRADATDFTEEDWDAVVDVNLKACFFMSQAFARHVFAASQRGKIINVASMLSFQGGIRVASYTASKSGVAGITRLLANEWAARGINVNAIAPGYFATANTQALRADPERSREILSRIPAGQWGQPSDLAGAAVFLAATASDYVHGAIVPVDGGWLTR